MSEITREELTAFTSSHEKVAVVLEKIANQLETIALKQDKLVDKFDNGVVKEIIQGVTNNYNTVHKETIDHLSRMESAIANNNVIFVEKIPQEITEKLNNSEIAKDIAKVKWFIGIVGLVIIVATVILRGLDDRLVTKQNSENTQVLQHLLEQHMQETGDKVDVKTTSPTNH